MVLQVEAAVWAARVALEPLGDALAVEDVLARQLADGLPLHPRLRERLRKALEADAALVALALRRVLQRHRVQCRRGVRQATS